MGYMKINKIIGMQKNTVSPTPLTKKKFKSIVIFIHYKPRIAVAILDL